MTYRFLRGVLEDTACCALCGAHIPLQRVQSHAEAHAAKGQQPVAFSGTNEHVLVDVEVTG